MNAWVKHIQFFGVFFSISFFLHGQLNNFPRDLGLLLRTKSDVDRSRWHLLLIPGEVHSPQREFLKYRQYIHIKI